jgi:glyoxylase-like metal-dependent hydrolase (beta-lactamase superfamily II)
MPKNNAIKFELLRMPPENTVSMLVSVGDDAVIFDAWGRASDWENVLSERGLKLRAIYATHGHPDHISAAPNLAENFNVDWFLNEKDNFLIGWGNGLLDMFNIPHIDNDYKKPKNIPLGTIEFLPGIDMEVMESPGHTPGGLMFYFPKYNILMVGDTLFQESYGNTAFPGGDEKQLFESIGKLYKKDLPNGTWVIHGHGMETSIGWLKKHNKFFI